MLKIELFFPQCKVLHHFCVNQPDLITDIPSFFVCFHVELCIGNVTDHAVLWHIRNTIGQNGAYS